MDDLTLSIGDLARRTGVDIPTLRRWERYEGLLTPTRTPGGQRRYGAGDVAAVQEMVSLIGKGWAAASAARAVAHHRDTGAIVFDASLLDAVPTGVVVTNPASEVLYANPAIAAMLGVTKDDLEAEGGGAFLAEEDRRHVLEAFERMRRGEPQTYDARLRTRSGDAVEVEVAAAPMLGPGGQYRGIVGVFHDLRRVRDAEERAALLAQLLDASEDAVLAVDTDLRVVAWNAATARDATALAEGCALTDLFPAELAVPTIAAARRALDGETSTFELRARQRDDGGPAVEKQVRVLPLDAASPRAGAIVVTVDVVAQPDTDVDVGVSTAYHGVVATLTQSVLAGGSPEAVLDTAVRGVSRALDASHVSFVEVHQASNEIVVLASTADEPNATAPVEPFGSHVGFALQSQRPIVVQDFSAERRFDRGPFAGEQSARSGVCVPVRWRPVGQGALSVHSADARRELGPIEVTFVQSAANVCALALQGRDGPTAEERR
jgi:PAS domain S-box-containing protein